MRYLVIKDSEGVLRPQMGIWGMPTENFVAAVREQFAHDQKKKFKHCTLVEVELIEK